MDKKIKIIRLSIVGLVIVIVAVILGSMIKSVLERPRYFANLNEINSTLKTKEWRSLEDSLIAYNAFVTGEDHTISLLTIVPESYQESMADGDLTVSFVSNFDELRKSYEVYYTTSNGGQTTINCPPYIYNIYPEQSCMGMHNNSESLNLYLPQVIKMDDGQEVKIDAGWQDGEQVAYVSVTSCNDQSRVEAAIEAAEMLFRSMGLDPNEYRFVAMVQYNNCLME